MADRRIGTLSNYFRGSRLRQKTDFCEPHPLLSIAILFNIMLIIGQITHTIDITVCCSGCVSYPNQITNVGFMGCINNTRSQPMGWLFGGVSVSLRPCVYGADGDQPKLSNLYIQVITINVVTNSYMSDEH